MVYPGQVVYFGDVSSFPEHAISAVAKGAIFCQFSSVQVECITMMHHVLTKMGGVVAWGMAWASTGLLSWWWSWYVVLAEIAGGGCSIIVVCWDEDQT